MPRNLSLSKEWKWPIGPFPTFRLPLPDRSPGAIGIRPCLVPTHVGTRRGNSASRPEGFPFLIALGILAVSILPAEPLDAEEGASTSARPAEKTAEPELEEEDFSQALESALRKAGPNADELRDALSRCPPAHLPSLQWILSRIGLADALACDAEELLEHVELAEAVRSNYLRDWDEENFRRWILDPRIGPWEPWTPWRKPISEAFRPMATNHLFHTALRINRWMEEKTKVVDREDLGPSPDPVVVLRTRRGTTYDLAVLLVAAYRSLGIPARLSAASTWVEMHDGETWTPAYPLDSGNFGNTIATEESRAIYQPPGLVKVRAVVNGLAYLDLDSIGFSVFRNDGWWPFEPAVLQVGEESVDFSVTPGEYLVQVGARTPAGGAIVHLELVNVQSRRMEEVLVNLEVPKPEGDAGASAAVDKSRLGKVPEIRLRSAEGRTWSLGATLENSNVLVVFFSLDAERLMRGLGPFRKFREALAGRGVSSVGICLGAEDTRENRQAIEDLGIALPVYFDPKGESAVVFRLPRSKAGDWPELPSAILISQEGPQVVLWYEGPHFNFEGFLLECLRALRGPE